MRALYNLLLWLLSPLWLLYTLVRIGSGSWRERWWERFGFIPIPPPTSKRRLWVHCVSVGETLAALPVLKELRCAVPSYEIVLTTTTPTGQRTARDSAHAWVDYFAYFPLDLPFAVKNALSRIQPDALLLFETELWFNLIHAQHQRGGLVMVLNGRLSDRSFRRARRLRAFYRALLRAVDLACVQSPTDALRFVELGLSPSRVEVVGNTKFDQALEATDANPAEWRARLSLPLDAPVIVVGSTRTPDEEQLVVEAYQQVREVLPSTCLVLAPRHLERVPEVERLLRDYGFEPVRRTQLPLPAGTGEVSTGEVTLPVQVVLVDTFGELAQLYCIADVAVVGGAFAPLGGQNLFQPLAHGKPVFFGPHTHNFRDIALLAKEAGVGFEVRTAEELAEGILRLLRDEKAHQQIERNARELIARHQGAARRCAQYVKQWLERTRTPRIALR
jgi:3-deoxy-D-manno-octulosonic-acid transferase